MNDHSDTMRRLLLRVPNRRRIFEAIVEDPGIHARALSRDLGMALGVVEHHLRPLADANMVFWIQDGRRRAYFAAGRIDISEARWLHGLRRPGWQEVANILLQGEASVGEIARMLSLPPTTASYTLRRMRDAGWVDNVRVGRESLYMLRDPEGVRIAVGRVGRPASAFDGLLARAAPAAPPIATLRA